MLSVCSPVVPLSDSVVSEGWVVFSAGCVVVSSPEPIVVSAIVEGFSVVVISDGSLVVSTDGSVVVSEVSTGWLVVSMFACVVVSESDGVVSPMEFVLSFEEFSVVVGGSRPESVVVSASLDGVVE